MAPAIGGVISSESGSVSLTAVPSGGWMLALLVKDGPPPATPSGWISLASGGDGWRLAGKIKASETTLTVSASEADVFSVMWGTGAAAVGSWRTSAVGGAGSTSVSLAGTTAGSRLIGADPYVYQFVEDGGYVSRSGAVSSHVKVSWFGDLYCVWLSGVGAGGTATATRSVPPGYESYLLPWVLVEIPESSNPAILNTTLPGPATAALTGTSTNPGAADTVLPGPPTAAIAGGASNPAVLDTSVPGPPAASISGGSTNPAALDAGLPGPLTAAIAGTFVGSILNAALPGPPTAAITGGSSNPGSLDTSLPGLTAAIDGGATNTGTVDTALPGPPSAAIAGGSTNPAAFDTSAPGPANITMAGGSRNPGVLNTTTAGPTAAITGLSTNPGSLDGVLPGPLTITAGVAQYGQIQLRRPPRTLDQLLRDGTRRRDLIRIMTGAHAGAELPVASWSLTLDHLATIRATGQAEVRHTPKLAALLDPRSRTELAMILAVEDDDGKVIEWPKALLHTVPMRRGDRLTIDLEDRAAWVRAAGMRTRMVMPRGMDVARALINLLSARAPWLPIDVPLSGVTLPQDAVLGGLGADPWQIAGELARATGQHLYIDGGGVARTAPIIDTLTADPVDTWSIDAAHLTDLQTTISDTDVVNVVGLEWQTTPADGAPPDSITGGVGWWIDDTSTVGTHILGDRVAPYPGDTSLITSPGQARDAAAAHGLTVQGIAVAVDIPGVRVDPRRDVGDIIRVQDSRLGLDLVTRLTGLTWTAGAPTMGVTLADRRML